MWNMEQNCNIKTEKNKPIIKNEIDSWGTSNSGGNWDNSNNVEIQNNKMRMKIGLNQTTKTIQIKIIIKAPIVRQIIEMKEVIRVQIMLVHLIGKMEKQIIIILVNLIKTRKIIKLVILVGEILLIMTIIKHLITKALMKIIGVLRIIMKEIRMNGEAAATKIIIKIIGTNKIKAMILGGIQKKRMKIGANKTKIMILGEIQKKRLMI